MNWNQDQAKAGRQADQVSNAERRRRIDLRNQLARAVRTMHERHDQPEREGGKP